MDGIVHIQTVEVAWLRMGLYIVTVEVMEGIVTTGDSRYTELDGTKIFSLL